MRLNVVKYLGNLVKRAHSRLRFVIERPSVLYEPEDEAARNRCSVCAWETRKKTKSCPLCGWPMTLRGIALQEELSKLFRRALLRDHKLVARVKAELPWLPDDVVCKQFTGQLAWLGKVWRRAGKPPGRPFDPTRHWGIVEAIEMLMRTHTLTPAKGGEPAFDEETQERRPARAGEMLWVQQGYELALTQTEAIKMLSGDPFPPGPVPPRRDGKPRRTLTGESLNAIGEDLRRRLGYPARREEIIRSLRWARRQRTSVQARWTGEPVRVRHHGSRGIGRAGSP